MNNYTKEESERFRKRGFERIEHLRKNPWGWSAPPSVAAKKKLKKERGVAPCLYRGEHVDESTCKSCGGTVRLNVFACSIHGRSTIARQADDRSIHVCADCPDRLEPTDSHDAPALTRKPSPEGDWKWGVAVTTAPRDKPLIQHTIASLFDAGFDDIHVFAEPGSLMPGWVTVHQNDEKVGAYDNYVCTLRFLVDEYPDAPAYLVMQDDTVLAGKGLRLWLERNLWPLVDRKPLGLVSLYTSKAYERDHSCWTAQPFWNWGACAFVWPPDMAKAWLESPQQKGWRNTSVGKKNKGIDACVGQWLQHSGNYCYVPTPSLAQHIGDESTVGHGLAAGSRHSTAFTGYNRAALDRLSLSGDRFQPGCTLITPTGDRHEAFRLCERWMSRQTYDGALQWIVVDDGQRVTDVTRGQEYIRRPPGDGVDSLRNNLAAAMKLVKFNRVLIIEDDDWYGPDYIRQMMDWLDEADLVGARLGRYFFLQSRGWYEKVLPREVALHRTGFTSAVYPTAVKACGDGHEKPLTVDIRIWRNWTGSKLMPDEPQMVSVKELPGRPSFKTDTPRPKNPDPQMNKLGEWIGQEVDTYRDLVNLHGGPGHIVVYTFAKDESPKSQAWREQNVKYLCFTDQKAVRSPWMVAPIAPDQDEHTVMTVTHNMLAEADWSIYLRPGRRLPDKPSVLVERFVREHPGRWGVATGEYVLRRRDASKDELNLEWAATKKTPRELVNA